MTEEHYSFHESEATVRLQSVVDAFIHRATAAYSHLPGMHVDRINSPANNRNLVLSRCAHYCLDHEDVLVIIFLNLSWIKFPKRILII